jgi:hypothetical protein
VKELKVADSDLYRRLRGKFLIKAEDGGKAYYVDPISRVAYFMNRPADFYNVIRQRGLGAGNLTLSRIAPSSSYLSGGDIDGDGLTDDFEAAIGTKVDSADSDGDSFSDKLEIDSGYNPLGKGKAAYSAYAGKTYAGRILLQVKGLGQAWYIQGEKRYFLGGPLNAFNIVKNLGIGISNADFNKMTASK